MCLEANRIGEVAMDEYMTKKKKKKKWGIGIRRINTLCNEGRIAGCVRFGVSWAIPSGSVKPLDMRIKSGKYIKAKESEAGS